jgi:hypothetical protein
MLQFTGFAPWNFQVPLRISVRGVSCVFMRFFLEVDGRQVMRIGDESSFRYFLLFES